MPHRVFEDARTGGRPVFGGWVATDSEAVVGAVERSGVDWIGFDCQHGGLSEASAGALIRRMQTSPCATLVRVSEGSASLIARVLDVGADGVIVPMISTVQEAEAVVAACRFPPQGIRSFGPARSTGLPFSPSLMQDRVSAFVMIETREGLENAEAICAVPGVAGVIVGPSDLAIGLGLDPAGALASGLLDTPMARLLDARDSNGILLGLFCKNGADAAVWARRGCRVVVLGGDMTVLTRGFASELAAAGAGRVPEGAR